MEGKFMKIKAPRGTMDILPEQAKKMAIYRKTI